MKHSGVGGCLLKIDVYPSGRARFVQDEPIAEVEEPDGKDPVSKQ